SFGVLGLMTGLLLLTSESRPAHGEAVPSQPAIKAPEKSAPLPGLAKRITLDLRQMDILAVLKFLSEQGDFNVVPGKNVGGRVTLAVKVITIQDAFDIIVLTNELDYVGKNPYGHTDRRAGQAWADGRGRRGHGSGCRAADPGLRVTVRESSGRQARGGEGAHAQARSRPAG